MNKEKIFCIIALIVIIIAIVVIVVKVNPTTDTSSSAASNTLTVGSEKSTNVTAVNETNNNTETSLTEVTSLDAIDLSSIDTNTTFEYIKTVEDDGILYSVTGEKIDADVVVGDNYFDTTINDMYLNPSTYDNKTIEIEGFYLETTPYTFVGRYSTSNLCQYCPVGYSYLEYQLRGTIDDVTFVDSDTWIKVVGTLAVGNDETSYYQDYYYLNVLSLEIMNEKGQETVSN